jgi:NitT/TauT family transport system ATP-binding protein
MQIECCALTKVFDGRTIFRDLDWKIEAGDFWCVCGPSGIGKTTLLRILLGLEKADKGTVKRTHGLRFAPVFQEDRFLQGRSALQNCMIFTASDETRAREMLIALLEDADAIEKPIELLSGGMRRRVALARALLSDGDVLCLDEPFAGLDADTRARVWNLLAHYRAGRTVILVSHEFRPENVKYLDLT